MSHGFMIALAMAACQGSGWPFQVCLAPPISPAGWCLAFPGVLVPPAIRWAAHWQSRRACAKNSWMQHSAAPPGHAIDVFLADDNLIVREGVRALIERNADLRVVGVAADYDGVVSG